MKKERLSRPYLVRLLKACAEKVDETQHSSLFKLDDAKEDYIRNSSESVEALAAKYNISHGYVSMIRNGLTRTEHRRNENPRKLQLGSPAKRKKTGGRKKKEDINGNI